MINPWLYPDRGESSRLLKDPQALLAPALLILLPGPLGPWSENSKPSDSLLLLRVSGWDGGLRNFDALLAQCFWKVIFQDQFF